MAPENFRKFARIFLWKVQKCIILAYFTQNFTNPALTFRAFGRKTQIVAKFWKFLLNINREIKILTIFGKDVAKNRAFGNNIIFPQQFFPFRGRGDSRRYSWLRHWLTILLNKTSPNTHLRLWRRIFLKNTEELKKLSRCLQILSYIYV